MTQPNSIAFDTYETLLDVIDINPSFKCISGAYCTHDKYRQAAKMLSSNDTVNEEKLFNVLFQENTKIECGMHNATHRAQNKEYKSNYTFYQLSKK